MTKKVNESIWIETLGCAKNEVDSQKLHFRAQGLGYESAKTIKDASMVVINTCAFIEAARAESISVILDALEDKAKEAKIVVTGCMAERYRQELTDALPEVDLIVGFGEEFMHHETSGIEGSSIKISKTRRKGAPSMDLDRSFDLLNLPIGPSNSPFSYLKVAEGCDRKCGFCAIPSFRGKQQSRDFDDLVAEAETLASPEIIVIAQDLASYGRDLYGSARLVELVRELMDKIEWVRLLYLYPSQLNSELIDLIGSSRVNYFDLSLQHVSKTLLRQMRRPGSGSEFLEKIRRIRELYPSAVFRSNFIVGYPGETEDDHDELLEFIEAAQLDWVGFFGYSKEQGTYADSLEGQIPSEVIVDRLAQVSQAQEAITALRRRSHIGRQLEVVVQSKGVGRSYMESPEIDGLIVVPSNLKVGSLQLVEILDCIGLDLVGEPVEVVSDKESGR